MVLPLGSVVLTLVLLSSFPATEGYTERIYHIKPTPDTLCPTEPCLTLSEYAQGQFLTSDTTLIFLPGNHSLDRDISVTNVTRFVMLGDSTSSPNITSTIVCKGPEMLTFQNTSLLQIHFLQISSCGSDTVSALSVVSVSRVEILGSMFQGNGNPSLLVVGSMLNCSETSFSSGLGTGLSMCNSHTELHNSVFSDNSGAGINSTNSTLTLMEPNIFVNNTADFGGGVSATESSIYITGNATFLDNSVTTSGGGVFLERSTLSCNGTMVFARNIVSTSDFSTRITGFGGGISVLDSEINLEGKSTFVDNVAIYGGGVGSFSSNVTFRGSSNFVNNSATLGGGILAAAGSYLVLNGNTAIAHNLAQQGAGIYLEESSISSTGCISFVSNLADRGGGLASWNGIITLREGCSFVNNSATLGGGIFATAGSYLTLNGNNAIAHNLAEQGAGICLEESSISCTGYTSFASNLAMYGGGLVSWNSTVIFQESSNFVNNSATLIGGGILVAAGSDLTLNGSTAIRYNFAQLGAGMNVEDSSVSGTGYTSFMSNLADRGGALASLNGIITLRGGSSFVNNSATLYGGGIFAVARSDLTLNGNTAITHNLAHQGAGINVQDSSISCTGYTRFVRNVADDGGGLLLSHSTVTMKWNSSFVNNSADQFGGGIFAAAGSDLSLYGSVTFTYNLATQGAGMNVEDSSISYTGCTSFINNVADRGGGLMSLNGMIKMRGGSSFVNNSATLAGGGIFAAAGSDLTLNGNTAITYNWAEQGAGMNVQDSSISFTGYTSLVSNLAVTDGGGLQSSNSTVTLKGNSSFVNNSACLGGGIFATTGSHLTLNGNTAITNNLAEQGAGMNVQDSSISCMGYTSLVSNVADKGGGLVSMNSTVTMKGNSSFVNNSACLGGGIFAVAEGHLTLNGNTAITHNWADQGAGMNVQNSTISCTGYTSLVSNVADTEGGGLWSSNSTVTMEGGNNFVNNSATLGGGILAAAGSDMTLNGNTTITNNLAEQGAGMNVQNSSVSCTGYTSFMNNVAIGGGGLASLTSTVTMKGNSSFVNNSADDFGGGVAVSYGTDLKMHGSITFIQNKADLLGGGMFVTDSSIGFNIPVNNLADDNGGYDSFSRCTFTQNTAIYGGGAFLVNSSVSFMEKSDFHNNSAVYGGGIHGSRANLEISKTVSFTANFATNGGGLSLASESQCFLTSNSTVYFEGNHAEQYGGAIFVTDESFLYCTRDQPTYILVLTREHCFFQPLDLPSTTALFILENNTAEKAGAALYGGMVDKCILNPVKYNSGEVFDELFNIIRNNNTREDLIFSSDPFQVCPCHDGHPNCSQSEVTVSAYPGETFPVFLVAVGQRDGVVPSLIQSSYNRTGASLGDLQHAQSANNTCTPLYYTVSSTNPLVTMTLLADGPCLDLGESLQVNIHLKTCPIGFELSEVSKVCVCEERLQRHTNSCDIDDLTIHVDGNAWVGLARTADGIILHSHCPFDYCKSQSVRFTLNETDLQCNYDRRGLLCGGCQPGLSLALGSSHCLQCSNAYLSLLVGFALAGIALVILLLVCKLTVAVGTINGLIFYANIIAVNQSVFFPSGDTSVLLDILKVFIAWLNLDLGIETCFYDGMDAYARTWLQFIFPVYIWVLVFTVIILCYYKTWAVRMFGRNPVAVLATLFLLSYAKLLRTIITALSFTFPEYPDGSEVAVWLNDGNLRYLQGKHIPLFLVSMTVLLLLFLPYTLVLLFGQWMQAHSNMRLFSWINDHRVKAFLDAYHGPFRKEHRYWSGLLLVFRSCLFLLFAFNALGNPNVNLLATIICTAVLTLLTLFTGRIYVNWYLQGLESSFAMNTLIFAAATLYLRSANEHQAALTYTSVGIALVTFAGMIIYHVTIQLKDSRVWRDTIQPKLQRHQRQWAAVPLEDPVADVDPNSVPPHSPTCTFINLRETLLEDSVPDVDAENTVAGSERYIVQRHLQPTQTVIDLQQLIHDDPANNVLEQH